MSDKQPFGQRAVLCSNWIMKMKEDVAAADSDRQADNRMKERCRSTTTTIRPYKPTGSGPPSGLPVGPRSTRLRSRAPHFRSRWSSRAAYDKTDNGECRLHHHRHVPDSAARTSCGPPPSLPPRIHSSTASDQWARAT